MSKERTWSIPLMSYLLRDLKSFVEEATKELPKDMRDATTMVAFELACNALQHGVSVPELPNAAITLNVTGDQLRFEVKNGVPSAKAAEELQTHISRITTAESREQLYMKRLQQMLDDPKETGKLGLLRIGFEGNFDLSCDYSNPVVTVVAVRGIP